MKMIALTTLICLSLLAVGLCIPLNIEIPEEFISCDDKNLSLNFSNVVIQSIGDNFIASPLITCLNLKGNSIKNVAHNAFDQLPNLKYLNLAENYIPVKDIPFSGHSEIEVLILGKQHYESWPYQTLHIYGSYPKLQYMDCSSNKMGYITLENSVNGLYTSTINTDSPFPELKHLDLSHNHLSSENFFDVLPVSLTHLYLHDNQIRSISLSRLTNLTVLTLDENTLSDSLALSGLTKLKYLSMSHTQLKGLDRYLLDDLPMLEYLDVSFGRLQTLEEGVFESMTSLKTLLLDQNSLHSVPEFTVPLNIETLSMSCNNVQRLTSVAFESLPSLKNLTLDGNGISIAVGQIFRKQSMLEELRLASNQLTSLPDGWCDSCESLQHLDLSDNRFASLETLALSHDLPLRVINLRKNPLDFVNLQSVEGLPENATVNLNSTYGGQAISCTAVNYYG